MLGYPDEIIAGMVVRPIGGEDSGVIMLTRYRIDELIMTWG